MALIVKKENTMLTNLNFVLDTLHIHEIKNHYNEEKTNYFYCARWLGNTGGSLDPNCIYIGYASMLPPCLPESEIAVIICNDTDRDFSGCTVDLVELPARYNMAELCIQIKEKIFHTYEISSISQQMIERIIRSSTIKEIVDLTASLLENPVFINFHFSERRFFHSPASQIETEVELLMDIKRAVPSPDMMKIVTAIWDSPYATISEDGLLFRGKRRMQVPISKGVKGGPRIGILTVFEINREFTPRDQAFVNFIGYLFSIRAEDAGFEKQLSGYQYEQKLQDLLSGSPAPTDMEWTCALFGNQFSNFSLALTDVKNLMPSQLENLKYFLLQSSHYSTTLVRGSYLILIANRRQEQVPHYLSTLEKASGQYGLSFGISDDFADIRKLKKYYTQAKRVRDFHLDTAPGCHLFSQNRLPILIHDVAGVESPDLFSDDTLNRLLAYDADKNTEYCKTLATYIQCGMNKDLTRKELNIHRNTLIYRLDKIEEILGHSLNEGSYLINLYLSMLIYEHAES